MAAGIWFADHITLKDCVSRWVLKQAGLTQAKLALDCCSLHWCHVTGRTACTCLPDTGHVEAHSTWPAIAAFGSINPMCWCRDALKGYPTSIDEDLALLRDTQPNTREDMAIRVSPHCLLLQQQLKHTWSTFGMPHAAAMMRSTVKPSWTVCACFVGQTWREGDSRCHAQVF